MAQVTIYLPDELARRLRQEAKRAGKSLSAYLVELATRGERPGSEWPEGFAGLYGSCDLSVPEEPPLEEVESLDPS